MARAAGIVMPETHLFGADKKRYFGIQRFDRDGDRRVHMHSLSGLLHADHRAPTLDYDALLTATLALTRDATEMARAFRLACFNVLAHNRDDHAKNVSFLLDDKTGRWTLAPAYDLTFSSGPGGEQSMLVMGEGRAPGVEHLRALAKKHGLKKGEAVIDGVRAAVARWSEHADAAGLSKRAAKLIADRIVPAAAEVAKPAGCKSTSKKKSPGSKRTTKSLRS
jgi:serine/threonine-protein kinase HipA